MAGGSRLRAERLDRGPSSSSSCPSSKARPRTTPSKARPARPRRVGWVTPSLARPRCWARAQLLCGRYTGAGSRARDRKDRARAHGPRPRCSRRQDSDTDSSRRGRPEEKRRANRSNSNNATKTRRFAPTGDHDLESVKSGRMGDNPSAYCPKVDPSQLRGYSLVEVEETAEPLATADRAARGSDGGYRVSTGCSPRCGAC